MRAVVARFLVGSRAALVTMGLARAFWTPREMLLLGVGLVVGAPVALVAMALYARWVRSFQHE